MQLSKNRQARKHGMQKTLDLQMPWLWSRERL